MLRDETTPRKDFIFFVDRLATFLVEKAMELLPYKDKTIITPTGAETSGKELDVKVRSYCRLGISKFIASLAYLRCLYHPIVRWSAFLANLTHARFLEGARLKRDLNAY